MVSDLTNHHQPNETNLEKSDMRMAPASDMTIKHPHDDRERPIKDTELISIVLPVYNEEESIRGLLEEIKQTMDRLGRPYEVITVNDGSSDGTRSILEQAAQDLGKEFIVISLAVNRGQTTAMKAGFDHARGDIVVSLDADGQNDPEDIPPMISKLEEGFDVVCGWRKGRKDNILKKLPSKFSNSLNRRLNKLTIHDAGCTLRVYRSKVLRGLPLKGEMHRYMTAIFAHHGYRITEVVTNHRKRAGGKSKYGMGRLLRGFTDLVSQSVVMKHGHSPFRFFFRFFNWCFLIGLLIWAAALWTAFSGPSETPFSNDSVGLIMLIGLLVEIQALQFLALAFAMEISAKGKQGLGGPRYSLESEPSTALDPNDVSG